MDSTNWLVVGLIALWVGGGIWVALRMARAGHDLKLTLPLGLLLGPFLAWFAGSPPPPRPQPAKKDDRGSASAIDVLVGLDGSPQSASAAKAAVELLGPSLSSLTLATVLDYEDQGPRSGLPSQSAAYGKLVDTALDLGFEPTELELLYGPPARALAELASASGVELIVVGAHGHGLSERLLGSVAARLVEISRVPILVVPGRHLEADPHMAGAVGTGAGFKP